MNKIFVILIICLISIGFVLASGCASAENDIANSKSLMDKGHSTIQKINYDTDSSELVKSKLNEGITDYQQALSILTNAKTDNDDEKVLIAYYIAKCNYAINLNTATIHSENIWSHLTKSSAYSNTNDYKSAHNELSLAKNEVTAWVSSLKLAKKAVDSINPTSVPTEDKSSYNIWITIGELIDSQNDYLSHISALDHEINANSYLAQAQVYLNANDAVNEKAQLILAKNEFQSAKNNYDSLKNSKTTEISVAAIQLSSSTGQKISYIDQLISSIQ